jgi:hypothetical protein
MSGFNFSSFSILVSNPLFLAVILANRFSSTRMAASIMFSNMDTDLLVTSENARSGDELERAGVNGSSIKQRI